MASMTIIQGNQNTTKLINQLKVSSRQYKSLSKNEEQEMINKYKNDRDKLNHLLFMHNIKIVFNMAKHYMSKTSDYDGLVQDGMIGLGEAVKRFDITRNIKFITYAEPWIKKYILSRFYGKQAELDKLTTSLNIQNPECIQNSNNGQDVSFENYINEYIEPTQDRQKSIFSELSAHEQTEICKQLIDQLNEDNSLSSDDKQMFIEYIYNKEKTKNLAEKYGKTVLEITNMKKNILQKMKTILQDQFHIQSYDDIGI